jgi:hypothetical protein
VQAFKYMLIMQLHQSPELKGVPKEKRKIIPEK